MDPNRGLQGAMPPGRGLGHQEAGAPSSRSSSSSSPRGGTSAASSPRTPSPRNAPPVKRSPRNPSPRGSHTPPDSLTLSSSRSGSLNDLDATGDIAAEIAAAAAATGPPSSRSSSGLSSSVGSSRGGTKSDHPRNKIRACTKTTEKHRGCKLSLLSQCGDETCPCNLGCDDPSCLTCSARLDASFQHARGGPSPLRSRSVGVLGREEFGRAAVLAGRETPNRAGPSRANPNIPGSVKIDSPTANPPTTALSIETSPIPHQGRADRPKRVAFGPTSTMSIMPDPPQIRYPPPIRIHSAEPVALDAPVADIPAEVMRGAVPTPIAERERSDRSRVRSTRGRLTACCRIS